ncbi:TPA: hypothetical protein O9O04_002423 [Staphylococcus aureus]|nr:Uncharacterised protein [Staphylococcus aureus]HBC4337051.1 hypothetical protein [Staphylococcus aureus]HBC8081573.1 hypothetical protein [Staphylococcus aureus]HCW7745348.1 hypothetical protein [Staphylococcus aureus]HCY1194660.1 hypothetical protein [Staphylococcus aureus]
MTELILEYLVKKYAEEEYRSTMYDSNARLNIITENGERISDSVATMLSRYNVEVIPFDDKRKLKRKFSNV